MGESYPKREGSDLRKHEVYQSYLNRLGLNMNHLSDLKRRGLGSEHIQKAEYKTKMNNGAKEASVALGRLVEAFGDKLDNVPGFFIDNAGNRTQAKNPGLLIPSRDVNGKVSSLLIRSDNPKQDKSGKSKNKYLAFSSAGETKGAKVWQSAHCPIVKGMPKEEGVVGTTVRITEGVLKADVATALDDIYCLGMHGLNIPENLVSVLIELEVSEIRIALDAGEDGNSDMVRAKIKLIEMAREQGFEFKLEMWDAEHGKGIDDVLANGKKEKIRFASQEEIDAIFSTTGDWIYVIGIERFINVKNFQMLKKGQYADKYRLGNAYRVDELIESGHVKMADALTFLPKGNLIIEEDGLTKLNEWRDPKLVPMAGDISPFLEHLTYLFPDAKQRDVFLDWAAHNIQHPSIKILWALVIVGGEGVGKSYLGDVLKRLVGEDNTSLPTNEQLHEVYTGWQKKCQLVLIEELMVGGKRELMNKLKPIITQLTTKIREMHKEPYTYPNRFNILAFTNHEDALLLSEGDRRYGVLKVAAEKRVPDYYKRLWSWTEKPESIQAVLEFLLTRNIEDFNPNAGAPETQAKADMIKNSLSPLDEWVSNCIADKCWPLNGEIVAIRHLRDKNVCQQGLERFSYFKWAEALRKQGAIQYEGQVPLSDGTRINAWLIGAGKNILENLSPSDLARIYEADPLKYTFDMTPSNIKEWESVVEELEKSGQTPGTNDTDNVLLRFKRETNPITSKRPL